MLFSLYFQPKLNVPLLGVVENMSTFVCKLTNSCESPPYPHSPTQQYTHVGAYQQLWQQRSLTRLLCARCCQIPVHLSVITSDQESCYTHVCKRGMPSSSSFPCTVTKVHTVSIVPGIPPRPALQQGVADIQSNRGWC